MPSRTVRALPKGIMKSGAGIVALVVGLAVEVLGLQEEHRVVAADGGAQQAGGIQGRAGIDHPQAGDVGEGALAALAVVDGAAHEVAADGHPHHHGGLEVVVASASGCVASSSRICCMAGQM